ncbi:MAG: extracellular solute-binding protein [Trueperaceae bacterium]
MITRAAGRGFSLTIAASLAFFTGGALAQSDGERLAAAQQEGQVTVYSSFPVARLRPVLDAFEADYPAISAEQLYAQTGQAISRVLAEHDAGRRGFDILITAWDPGYFTMDEQGALAHYDSPAAEQYDTQWAGPDHAWLNIWAGAQVIGYNTTLVDDPPQSWQDLADPRFEGQIAVGNPQTRGGVYWFYYHMYKLHGEQFLGELADNGVIIAPGPSAIAEWITSGRAPIGVTTDYSIVTQQDRGAPVDWVHPSEGVFFQVRGMAMAEDAPHPNAACIFYDWLVSEAGGQAVVDVLGLYSLNPNVAAPAGLPSLDELTILETDLEDFVEQEESITQTATDLLGAE